MATFERHVDVDWRGSVMEGKGEAKAGSGAFSLPVTFPNRVGEAGGKTSPEELMAAAHAACYAMALNGTLGRKSASADRTVVRATITADKGDAGIKIMSSKLVRQWMLNSGVKVAPRDGRSAHSLRHTAASDALDAGVNIRVVQGLVGNPSIGTSFDLRS